MLWLNSNNTGMHITKIGERLDTMSSVKLRGFRSQLEASHVSSHPEELWYNETVCQGMTIYRERVMQKGKYFVYGPKKNPNKLTRKQEKTWRRQTACAKKKGGSGLASIQDSVEASTQIHEDYIKKREVRLITATRYNTDTIRINRTKITRKQKWKENQLYGCFRRQTSKNSHEKTWTWLRTRNLERETEYLLIEAQNNAIKTNYVQAKLDKMQQNNRCGWCVYRDKTINHIISECSKLGKKEYKTRYDLVGKVIHWELYNKFKFDHMSK